MHGPYNDPYEFPELNGGKPADYNEHHRKIAAQRKKDAEEKERKLYEQLKKKFEN